MKQLGNRGQTLVLFVLLVPIVILVMVLVIDVGNVVLDKRKLDNINKIVINYGLSNINDVDIDKKMESLFNLNVLNDKASIEIEISDNVIYVDSEIPSNLIFDNILDLNIFKIKSSYRGSIVNDKYILEKN